MPDTHAPAGYTPHVLRDEADARLHPAAGERERAALLRRLDRESPGWRGQA